MKLDILAIGIHPDDVELGCAGTLAKHKALGYKIGICDLTCGEMGTRGTDEIRLKEAEDSKIVLGLDARENLFLEDVWAEKSKENILKIVTIIRKYKPDIVLCNAKEDRHPDHGKGADMVREAVFISGLQKAETILDGVKQEHFRPRAVYHYIQSRMLTPDFVVDISDYFDVKMNSIHCFKSQFFNGDNDEPDTFISDKDFLKMIEAKDLIWGKTIGVKYAEGFQTDRYLGINNLVDTI